jgi:hypothetical protein
VDRPRRYLGERFEHKSSAVHPRVRDDQAALENLPLPIERYIESILPDHCRKCSSHPHLNPLEAIGRSVG